MSLFFLKSLQDERKCSKIHTWHTNQRKDIPGNDKVKDAHTSNLICHNQWYVQIVEEVKFLIMFVNTVASTKGNR